MDVASLGLAALFGPDADPAAPAATPASPDAPDFAALLTDLTAPAAAAPPLVTPLAAAPITLLSADTPAPAPALPAVPMPTLSEPVVRDLPEAAPPALDPVADADGEEEPQPARHRRDETDDDTAAALAAALIVVPTVHAAQPDAAAPTIDAASRPAPLPATPQTVAVTSRDLRQAAPARQPSDSELAEAAPALAALAALPTLPAAAADVPAGIPQAGVPQVPQPRQAIPADTATADRLATRSPQRLRDALLSTAATLPAAAAPDGATAPVPAVVTDVPTGVGAAPAAPVVATPPAATPDATATPMRVAVEPAAQAAEPQTAPVQAPAVPQPAGQQQPAVAPSTPADQPAAAPVDAVPAAAAQVADAAPSLRPAVRPAPRTRASRAAETMGERDTAAPSRDTRREAGSAAPVSPQPATRADAIPAPADDAGQQLAAAGTDRTIEVARHAAWADGIASDIASASAATGTARFGIAPATLGPVQVEVTRGDDGASVRFTAASADAAAAISDAAPKLFAEARANGLNLRDVAVDLGRSDAGGSNPNSGGDHHSQPSQPIVAPDQPATANAPSTISLTPGGYGGGVGGGGAGGQAQQQGQAMQQQQLRTAPAATAAAEPAPDRQRADEGRYA